MAKRKIIVPSSPTATYITGIDTSTGRVVFGPMPPSSLGSAPVIVKAGYGLSLSSPSSNKPSMSSTQNILERLKKAALSKNLITLTVDGYKLGKATAAMIPGDTESVLILHDNKSLNGGWSETDEQPFHGYTVGYAVNSYTNMSDLTVHKEKKAQPKPVNVDECLKSVILPDDVRSDILAVLKQSVKQDKIFNEWGLGETIAYGKGMTFLFWGKPGTGKTLTAKSIANGLGKELIVMDTGMTQSQEPGYTQRMMTQMFEQATKKNAVLLLDECDSFVASRTNLGMVLGSEVNHLLTEIEKFEGILILTTNRIEDLDEAVERRISLIVEYKDPSPEQRKAIFETIIPKKMPLSDCVDLDTISLDYPLTGGQIKNVVLQAARLAAADDSASVRYEHFRAAIKRVLASRGRMGSKQGLGFLSGRGKTI